MVPTNWMLSVRVRLSVYVPIVGCRDAAEWGRRSLSVPQRGREYGGVDEAGRGGDQRIRLRSSRFT
jgi:hypothetical protein